MAKYLSFQRMSIILAIITITAGSLALLYFTRPQTTPIPRERPAPRINVITLVQDNIEPILELYGTVESPQKVVIKSPVTTYVQNTPFFEGDTVKKGQSLITLDKRDPSLLVQTRQGNVNELHALIESERARYQADLKALTSDKELVQLKMNNVKREQHLVKRSVGSPQRLEAAEQELENQKLALTTRELAIRDHQNRLASLNARLKRANAELAQAELDLQRASAPAPFDGRITALNVAVGDRITSGQAIIELFNTQEVEIRAQVPHNAVAYLYRVLAGNASLKAWATIHDTRFALRLDRLAGEIDARRAGVDALFSIDEQGAYLALGHTIPLRLHLTPRNDVFAVPITAITDENRVYRVNKSKLERIDIERAGYTLDPHHNRLALIKSPVLRPNDAIMVSRLPHVANGMHVTVIPDKPRESRDKE